MEAAIAEKRFDPIEHTRERARRLLESTNNDIAQELLRADARADLVEFANKIGDYEDAWFAEWLELFSRPDGSEFTDTDVETVSSPDPIIGWTAANLARRATLSSERVTALRERYVSLSKAPETETDRWRIVHAVGREAAPENVEFLLGVFSSEAAHQVQYGAVRAIVEVTSLISERAERPRVLERLSSLIDAYDAPEKWMRKATLTEVVEAAKVDDPPVDWLEDLAPVFVAVVGRADPEHKNGLDQNVNALRGL